MRTAFRIITTFALMVAIGFGGLTFSVHNQRAQLQTALANVQTQEAQEILPALQSLRPALAPSDVAVSQIIEEIFTRPLLPGIDEAVAQLSSGHHQLAALLRSVSADETLALRPEVGVLKRISQGKGASFPALDAYNQDALRWNEREKSSFGASIVNFYELKKVPLLAPDGRTEFAPTVML